MTLCSRFVVRLTTSTLLIYGSCQFGGAQQLSDSGPCSYNPIDINKYGHKPFQNPPVITSAQGELNTTLQVTFTDPAAISIGGCGVTLRSYNGALSGPTLRAKPGDVLNIRLENKLPKESPDTIEKQYLNEASAAHLGTRPNGFNVTNLHTHGLHVSPTGNSDNVLLAIQPGDAFGYEIKLPAKPAPHPRGTFWYHAHAHGSTAIQVGSALAGALILDDDDAAIPPALQAANRGEKILMFQTILYNTDGRLDDITKLFPGPQTATPCECSKEQHPENYGTWPCANRLTTVNGQIVPRIQMRPGEVQRWRMIDAAFRESIHFAIEGHDLHEIALDGLYLGKVDHYRACGVSSAPLVSSTCGNYIDLEPGYRSDILLKASKVPGTYRVVDLASSAGTSLRGAVEQGRVLAEVVIAGEPMDMALPTDAEMANLAPFPGVNLSQTAVGIQQAVYKLGTDLTKVPDKPDVCGPGVNPLRALSRAASNMLQPVTMSLTSTAPPPAQPRLYFQINYEAFNPSHVRQLKLNSVDQWTLTTVGDPPGVPGSEAIPPLSHVFHIHVNPFQYVRKGPDGTAEMVWKDTVLVPAGQTLNLFTKYTDYIGQFVMHCHILDHEDLGMMEIDEVVDESSGLAAHAHGH